MKCIKFPLYNKLILIFSFTFLAMKFKLVNYMAKFIKIVNYIKVEENFLLKGLRMIFGLIAFILAIYALITKKFILMPYIIFSLGLMFLIMGFSELRKGQKTIVPILFLVSGFNIFVAIFTFFS